MSNAAEVPDCIATGRVMAELNSKIIVARQGDQWSWLLLDAYGDEIACGPARDQDDALTQAWSRRESLQFPDVETRAR